MWSSCRRWGQFPEVKPARHRRYVRAYWRFLLNWEYPPLRTDVPPTIGRTLRSLATSEVLAYRKYAETQGGATIITFNSPPPPPPLVELAVA
jgi:hypothetical protein